MKLQIISKKLILSNYIYKSKTIQNDITKDINGNLELYVSLSSQIDLNAKILHVSDDYGQLDLLLNYYSNSRKIYTYIAEISKRKIAAHNFIGMDRSIHYLECFKAPLNVNTLLFSVAIPTEDLNLNSVQTVIIFKGCIDEHFFMTNGYKTSERFKNFIVLKKVV